MHRHVLLDCLTRLPHRRHKNKIGIGGCLTRFPHRRYENKITHGGCIDSVFVIVIAVEPLPCLQAPQFPVSHRRLCFIHVPVKAQPELATAPLGVCMGQDTNCRRAFAKDWNSSFASIRDLQPPVVRRCSLECLARFAHRRCENKNEICSKPLLYISILFLHIRNGR